MWAKQLKDEEKARNAIFVDVEKWLEEAQAPVRQTVGFAVDRQALHAFKKRIGAGLSGVVAIGENRDCRVDLTKMVDWRFVEE